MRRDVKRGCWIVYEMVRDSVHNYCLCDCPSVLPAKSADYLTGTSGGPVVPSRPPLVSFQLLDVGLYVGSHDVLAYIG